MSKKGENIYKRKDGRYEGRYIKYRDFNGKAKFGYVYGYKYSEVKAALLEAKTATNQDEPLRVIGKGTLTEFMSFWLDGFVREQVKESTYMQYYERINTHIIPALGNTALYQLDTSRVQEFVDALVCKKLAPSTIKNIVRVLFSAMKKAAELHITACNPCLGLTLPKQEPTRRRALSRSEQIALEKSLSITDGETRIGVLLALYTGLRIGEICALRWGDVDFPNRTLTVSSTIQRIKNLDSSREKTRLIEGAPKSSCSVRIIPIPPVISDKLYNYRSAAHGNYYVLSNKEKPVDPHTLRERFNKIAKSIGLDTPFHTLRHTFATRCLEYNFDVQTISEILGHSTASVTLKVYAHSVLEHKRQLANRLHILSEANEPSNEPSNPMCEY